MTEWERLVDNGFITDEFLKEEVICEYRVSSLLKKLWAVELDLLREFKRICAKHNLRYFAYAGTLLGAARHAGFIPWDDDLDVCMPREDYDKLISIYKDEFRSPYFLQTPYTDASYAFSFAKLRNVNTCFAAKDFIECPMNQGAFLDIFPLENADSHYPERREAIYEVLRKCSAFMSRDNRFIKNKHTDYARELTFADNDNILMFEKIQAAAKSSDPASAEFVSVEVSTIYPVERKVWPKEYFDKSIELPFLNTSISVPEEYKKVLNVMYRDYTKFPPVEQRGLHHANTIIDTDTPFDTVRERILSEMEAENAFRGEA